MSEPLAIYLHDHLAGAKQAIDLIAAIRDQYADEPLGSFAAGLLKDVEADRQVLQDIAERAGKGSSAVKEMTAWMAEKVARLKLGRGTSGGLGTLEALEFLELGIHGKWTLWRALSAIAPTNPSLQGIDFDRLISRAESQRESVEEHRIMAALAVLTGDSKTRAAKS